jgi:ABC-type lipoprotein release transport system permease subunit
MIGMTLAATVAATLLAAVIPARRAALLNPVEVIH